MDVARIHAENAIRQKNQAVNYLRMSARVDAVASRVQSALTTRKVTGSMAGVVKAMDAAMKGMNLEKISSLMEKFESQFEDLDVQSSVMEGTMSDTVTTSVPQGDVDNLLQQVADEAGLELNMELPSGVQSQSVGASTAVSQEQDELTQRLTRLIREHYNFTLRPCTSVSVHPRGVIYLKQISSSNYFLFLTKYIFW